MIAPDSLAAESVYVHGLSLQLRLLQAQQEIHRFYRFPGGDFSPAPQPYRQGRLDAPEEGGGTYGWLYAADTPLTAALECLAVITLPTDPPTYERSSVRSTELPPLRHVRLQARCAVRFVDFSCCTTAAAFGLNLQAGLDRLAPWRRAAAQVVKHLEHGILGADAVGICYPSQRRRGAMNFGMLSGRYQHVFEAKEEGEVDLNAMVLEA